MVEVTYVGRERHLAGHGHVTPGKKLRITEQNAAYLKQSEDPDFEFEDDKEEPDKSKTRPGKGEQYNLQLLPWSDGPEALQKWFAKKQKAEMLKILAQMKFQGLSVDYTTDTPPEHMIDQIIKAGKEEGWVGEA